MKAAIIGHGSVGKAYFLKPGGLNAVEAIRVIEDFGKKASGATCELLSASWQMNRLVRALEDAGNVKGSKHRKAREARFLAKQRKK